MTKVVWGDPPRSRQGGGRHSIIDALELLRAKPGEYARIRDYTRNTNASVAAAAFRKRYPEYDFTSRKLEGEGEVGGGLWARFRV